MGGGVNGKFPVSRHLNPRFYTYISYEWNSGIITIKGQETAINQSKYFSYNDLTLVQE